MRPALLLIDDNQVDRESVCRMLGDAVRVQQAETGREGLRAVREQRPDMVLLDHRLPDVSGLYLLERFVDQDIPTIILTGQGNEQLAVRAMKYGAVDYLVKSGLESSTLRRAVEHCLERSRLERQVEQQREALQRQVAEAQEREAYIRALLDALPDAILLLDADGVCLDWVHDPLESGEAQLDWPVGSSARDVLPPAVADRFEAAIRAALEEQRVQRLEFEPSPGGTFEARLSAAGEGRVLATARDLTRRKRLEAQLQAAMRLEAVGRLAGGVAHDFNNLLTVMLNQAALGREELPEGHPVRASLEGVVRAARRAADLVAQLLAFSRRRRVAPQVVALNDVVRDVQRMLQRVLGEDVRLELQTSDEAGKIRIDPGAFEQVLLNLAVNARDAMPEGGRLRVATSRRRLDELELVPDLEPGPYAVLEVSDTGVGMDAETLERCFEPFFTTKAEGRGTGLGLATCYGIVKQAGGHIWARSEPGEGTTFEVILPPSEGELTKQGRPASLTLPPYEEEQTACVLVVEDEPAVRDLVARVLRSRGYRILEAGTGVEALEVVAGEHVDLVVTDMVMPEMSGPELVAQLGELHPGLRVLFMSGFADHQVVVEGVSPDTPFLEKPFLPKDLLERVGEVLEDR